MNCEISFDAIGLSFTARILITLGAGIEFLNLHVNGRDALFLLDAETRVFQQIYQAATYTVLQLLLLKAKEPACHSY